MNKSVPTLLGVIVLLVVVVLVVLIYNIKLTNKLSEGLTPTGTVGEQALTGTQAPTDELAPAPGGTAHGQAKAAAIPANANKGEATTPAGGGHPTAQRGMGRQGGGGPERRGRGGPGSEGRQGPG